MSKEALQGSKMVSQWIPQLLGYNGIGALIDDGKRVLPNEMSTVGHCLERSDRAAPLRKPESPF
jgi:hypothetical protein